MPPVIGPAAGGEPVGELLTPRSDAEACPRHVVAPVSKSPTAPEARASGTTARSRGVQRRRRVPSPSTTTSRTRAASLSHGRLGGESGSRRAGRCRLYSWARARSSNARGSLVEDFDLRTGTGPGATQNPLRVHHHAISVEPTARARGGRAPMWRILFRGQRQRTTAWWWRRRWPQHGRPCPGDRARRACRPPLLFLQGASRRMGLCLTMTACVWSQPGRVQLPRSRLAAGMRRLAAGCWASRGLDTSPLTSASSPPAFSPAENLLGDEAGVLADRRFDLHRHVRARLE